MGVEMSYTVCQLAKLSGVSVRTLHHYDRIGLLKPAYHGSNGYRYYEEEQLLLLQQILFFRELGFKLERIKKVVGRGDFDKIAALKIHKSVLRKEIVRLEGLITTIDKTIKHLQGEKKMSHNELYEEFNKKEYHDYLIKRYGETAKENIAESQQRTKGWQKQDWQNFKEEGNAIGEELANALERKLAIDSEEVQALIERHYRMINRCYTPTREVYVGLGDLYQEHPGLRSFYEAFHKELPQFLAKAMKVYAEQELA